mmetsp:Transcript_43905/g.137476  ORF Transcript_43905/g.137476 Transcript_43905/m.137476 type:complete len:285 (+) Transcript_43905:947-1801(+)
MSTTAPPSLSAASSNSSSRRFRTMAEAAPCPSKRSTDIPLVRSVVSQRPSPSRSIGRSRRSVAGSSWVPARMRTRCNCSSTGTASSAHWMVGKSSDGVTNVCSAAEWLSDGEPQRGTQPTSSGCVQPARTRQISAKVREAPTSGDRSNTARPARATKRTSWVASSWRPPRQRAPVPLASQRPWRMLERCRASSQCRRNSSAVPPKRRITGLPLRSGRSSQSAEGSAHWYCSGGLQGVGPCGASGTRQEKRHLPRRIHSSMGRSSPPHIHAALGSARSPASGGTG